MESRHPYLDGDVASMNGNFSKDYFMLGGDKKWTADDVQLTTVSQIKCGRYTDNFVILCFGDSLNLDFFNDDKLSTVIYNAGMVSKMLRAGRFKGVFHEDENYFEPPHGWHYDTAWYPGYSLKQVWDKCRERGKASTLLCIIGLRSICLDLVRRMGLVWRRSSDTHSQFCINNK